MTSPRDVFEMDRWPFKPILICGYLACDYEAVCGRFVSLGATPALLLFVTLFGFLAAGLFAAAEIHNHAIRVGLALLLSVSSLFQQSFQWVAHGPLTYDTFINLYNARGNIDDAFAQNGSVLRFVFPITLMLFMGIVLPPRRVFSARLALLLPVAVFTFLAALVYQRGGEGTTGLPPAYPPIIYLAFNTYETLVGKKGPRLDVVIPRSPTHVVKDVILIVDESVSANYLDIDNPLGVDTGPLRDPPPGIALTNYGYASSIHNCSATSNLTLRFGGTRENYQKVIATGPSIWRYAKLAGLRTVYIDGQSNGGRLQNLMDATERAQIDEFIQFDGVPVVHRDMAIAKVLAAHINNRRPEFIYVNKAGAHFPVDNKYPAELTHYRPALARVHEGMLSWTSDRTGFNGTPNEWVRYRNSYRNALRWTVGDFFKRLFREANFNLATAIYTSDHGQDLHERGNPGRNTHCGAERAQPEEGLVPLLIIEGTQSPSRDWQKDVAENRNGMSHFRIFPTLLEMMGYVNHSIKPIYGPPLDDPAKDDFSFNMLFNTRLGRQPEWQRIDLRTIAQPPTADFVVPVGKLVR